MRSLETIPPLVVGSAGVGVTPGPSHWKTGVLVTPLGRVTEQVRVMVSPAMMEEEEEVREMAAGSGEEIRSNTLLSSHSIRESVDSLCRDDADMPMPPYIRKACNRPNAAFVSLFR